MRLKKEIGAKRTDGLFSRLTAVLLGVSAIFPARTLAEETLRRTAVGGLSFSNGADLTITLDELYVSRGEVRIAYEVQNRSSRTKNSVISFQFPEYGWTTADDPYDSNEGPLERVLIKVGDKRVPIRHVRSAWLEGRDVSSVLRQSGLSEEQIFTTFGDAEPMRGVALRDDVRTNLEERGAVKNRMPKWRVSMAAVWRHDFPPESQVTVELAYRPFVGWDSTWVSRSAAPRRGAISFSHWLAHRPLDACAPTGVLEAVEARAKTLFDGGSSEVIIVMNDVELFVTGNGDRKTSDRELSLFVDKGGEDDIVAICTPGGPASYQDEARLAKATLSPPPDSLVIAYYGVRVEEVGGDLTPGLAPERE